MGRLLDLARAVSDASVGVPGYEINEISEKRGVGACGEPSELQKKGNFWGLHGDRYGWRFNASLEAFEGSDYPSGMISWLEGAAPSIYDRLTRALPDCISREWEAKAAFDDFDALCCELEETHRTAVALYRQHLNAVRDAKTESIR